MEAAKIGFWVRLGRLITLPEQVDKLEDRVEHVIKKVDGVKETQTTCVTQDQLSDAMELHNKLQSEKLDLVIDLLDGREFTP
ncbi:MAG: hypothetical protein ACXABD_12565 [Candidatus Thorarchaeota archaeon]|jgi:hypothetical protein